MSWYGLSRSFWGSNEEVVLTDPSLVGFSWLGSAFASEYRPSVTKPRPYTFHHGNLATQKMISISCKKCRHAFRALVPFSICFLCRSNPGCLSSFPLPCPCVLKMAHRFSFGHRRVRVFVQVRDQAGAGHGVRERGEDHGVRAEPGGLDRSVEGGVAPTFGRVLRGSMFFWGVGFVFQETEGRTEETCPQSKARLVKMSYGFSPSRL